MLDSSSWHVFYVFTSTPNGPKPRLRHVAVPSCIDLYTFIRMFGAESGLGLYRRLDMDPRSPSAGQHLFQRGSVKLSIIPTQGTINDI